MTVCVFSRFIPDDVTFDNAVVTSEAGEVSSTHHPTPAFITTALQQSSVRLTWDETDPRRTAATMKKYNEEEVLNADLGDFLASSTSESECDGDEEGKGTSSQQKLTEEERLEKYKVSIYLSRPKIFKYFILHLKLFVCTMQLLVQ